MEPLRCLCEIFCGAFAVSLWSRGRLESLMAAPAARVVADDRARETETRIEREKGRGIGGEGMGRERQIGGGETEKYKHTAVRQTDANIHLNVAFKSILQPTAPIRYLIYLALPLCYFFLVQLIRCYIMRLWYNTIRYDFDAASFLLHRR